MKGPHESPEIFRFRWLTVEIIASIGRWRDVRIKNFLQVENMLMLMLITYLDLPSSVINLNLKGTSIHGHLIWKAKVPTRIVNFQRVLRIMGRIPEEEVACIIHVLR